eukprot:TRINITY_DN1572_c9_g1_i1.p1 TRINITY_DN1572_c9_g1~~TRINITY_DN1572_c9_g1_i1.p1  ORF type:complete len:541 (+),score=91.63 TRINITY_DN1572_c9_g1_i1:61-1683(+)
MGRGLRILGGMVGTAATGAIGAGLYDDGIKRTQVFWCRAFPIFLRYRWVQLLNRDLQLISDEEASKRYEALHDAQSEKAKLIAYDLRGFYLKNAQMMSTRDDFFPEQYLKWMKETEDQAPTPFEPGDAEKVIEQEAGRPVEELFSFFDTNPAGIASIGQVHRAILKSTGEEVAVKVQHIGAEELFRGDIATMKRFCKYFMPQHVPVFDEIEKQFLTEFDYTEEAKNLELVRKSIMPKWSAKVVIPRAYIDLCSKRVLVMEYLHGKKLIDGIKESYATIAAKMGKTLEELEAEQQAKIKSGEIKLRSIAEEHAHSQRVNMLIAVGDYVKNGCRILANITTIPYIVNLIMAKEFRGLQLQWTPIPLNMGDVMNTLVQVHADQLFTHGAFNGDPHPGNFLLLPDGRIGLIDFGQVKKLSPEERRPLGELMTHLSEGDVESTHRVMTEMGQETKYGDKEVAFKVASFWLNADTPDIMTVDGKVLNIAEFLDALEAKDPVKNIPDNLIMPGRMIILLRGLGMAFGMRLHMAQLFRPHADSFLDTV